MKSRNTQDDNLFIFILTLQEIYRVGTFILIREVISPNILT